MRILMCSRLVKGFVFSLALCSLIVVQALTAAEVWAHSSNDLVALEGIGGTTYCNPGTDFEGLVFFQRKPDGSLSNRPFKVPAGKFFVLTDTDWTAVLQGVQTFSQGYTVAIVLESMRRDGTQRQAPYSSQRVLVESQNLRNISGGERLTSGLRIGSGRILCANASQSIFTDRIGNIEFGGNGNPPGAHLLMANLRGYLIDKQLNQEADD